MARLVTASLVAAAHAAATQSGPQLALYTCDSSRKYQTFALGAKSPTLVLTTPMFNYTYCVDIADYSTDNGADVRTWPCEPKDNSNQLWTFTANSIQSQDPGQKCLTASAPAMAGSLITTNNCSSTDPLQQLHFDAASGNIVHVPSGLCVDAQAAITFCQSPSRANWTVCNPNAAIDDRAADIVSRLSLADKIASLSTTTPALPSVGLPAYK